MVSYPVCIVSYTKIARSIKPVGEGYQKYEQDTGVSGDEIMTEDTNQRSNSSVTSSESSRVESQSEWTRERWESLASDPEDDTDLGYELTEWEQFETLDETDQTMFLPADESELKDAAFVVAENSVVVNLENRC